MVSVWLCLFTVLSLVGGSHFRYGHISWEQLPGGKGRLFSFRIDTGYRRTWITSSSFAIGFTVSDPGNFFYPDTSATNVRFGVTSTVNSINTAEDWFLGTQTVQFEYARDGAFTAAFWSGNRISTMINNADLSYRLHSVVSVLSNAQRQSIRANILPIVTLSEGQSFQFQLPSISRANEVLRYRLSTASEAVLSNHFEQYKTPDGLKVDYATGLVSGAPLKKGLHNLQVTVEGHTPFSNPTNPANASTTLETTVSVDFLIQIVEPSDRECMHFCSNKRPCTKDPDCGVCITNGQTITTGVCDVNVPPVIRALYVNGVLQSPTSYHTINAVAGIPLIIAVTANDADAEDLVTVVNSAPPAGSLSAERVGNPGWLNISWTPTREQGGTVMCFTAFDSLKHSSIGTLCSQIVVKDGEMLAYGTGLTSAVAGEPTTIQIDNLASPSRSHNVLITGPQRQTVSSVSIAEASPRGAVYQLHNATYNPAGAPFINQTGFYTLVISDVTNGVLNKPPSLVYALHVRPANTQACAIFDDGETGSHGGIGGSEMTFFIRARDRFGNIVDEDRSGFESFNVTISYNSTFTTYRTTYVSPGVYRADYVVPVQVGSATLFGFSASIIQSGSVVSTCATWNGSIFTIPFSATIESDEEFVAGEPITFNVTRTSGMQSFSVLVGSLAATVGTAWVNNDGHSVFPVTLSSGLTRAGSYLNRGGIVVSASGFLDTFSFEIIPAQPEGSMSWVTGDIADPEAGKPTQIYIQLRDRFGNIISQDGHNISFEFFHSSPDEPQRSGFASFEAVTKLYEVAFMFTRVGSLTLSMTLTDTMQPIAGSPYDFRVIPGEISLTQSSVSNFPVVSAGSQGEIIIGAIDGFFNARDPAFDRFEVSFSSTSNTGNVSWVADKNSNRYTVNFVATETGFYLLALKAFVPSQKGYLLMRAIPIRVVAADLDRSVATVSGDGLSGGVSGEPSQLLVQTRDKYSNIVQDQRDTLVVVRITSTSSEPSFYLSTYREATVSECYTLTGFYSTLQSSFSIDDLTAEEQLLVADGYYEVYYSTPAVGPYQVSVFLANATAAAGELNGRVIAELPSSTLAFNAVATSRPSGFSVTGEENLGLILGLSIGLLVVVAVSGYGMWRLRRYRQKYKMQRERAEIAEKDLQDMAAEIDIIPGGKDHEAVGAATVTPNPLHELYASTGSSTSKDLVETGQDVTMTATRTDLARQEFKPTKFAHVKADQTDALRGMDSMPSDSDSPSLVILPLRDATRG